VVTYDQTSVAEREVQAAATGACGVGAAAADWMRRHAEEYITKGRLCDRTSDIHRSRPGVQAHATCADRREGGGAAGADDPRAAAQIAQEEVAAALAVGQPAVAKLEKRADMRVRNLRRYLEALGGRLEITAHFGKESVVVDVGEEA
jgi:hypothetical protein